MCQYQFGKGIRDVFMLKIAVCDDEEIFADRIKKLLENSLSIRELNIK